MLRIARFILVAAIASALLSLPGRSEPTAAPSVAPADNKALVQKLLALSHTQPIVEGWRDMLYQQQPLAGCGCTPEPEVLARASEAWKGAVSQRYDGEVIAAHIERSLLERMTAAEMKNVIAFYGTELGRKIHRAETPKNAHSSSIEQQLAELQRGLALFDADSARKKALLDLMASQDAIGVTVDLLMSIGVGTAIGTMAAVPDGSPRLSQDEVVSFVEAQRDTVREAMRPMLRASYASVFQSLSVAEIKRYTKAVKSPQHKKFAETYLAAAREALRAQTIAIGAAFTRNFLAERS